VADINVQRKQGPGAWPWVVGALVLALVIWGIIELTGGNGIAQEDLPGTAPPAAEQTQPAPPPPADPAQPGQPGTGTGQTGTGY
jgi:hypothetical protein